MTEKETLELRSGDVDVRYDVDRATEIFKELANAYRENDLIYGSKVEHTEEKFISQLLQKELDHPGITLNGLFLSTSLVFGGDTKVLFRKLYKGFDDYYWLFLPKVVKEQEEEDIREALDSYIQSNGLNISSIAEWKHNCEFLVREYDGKIENLFDIYDNDAVDILPNIMCGEERAKHKEDFRRYGTKLATLFLLWVDQYGLYDLKNTHMLGLPIDSHVRKFLRKTQILNVGSDIDIHNFSYNLSLPILSQAVFNLHNEGYEAWEIMNAVWGISTNECKEGNHKECVISGYCDPLGEYKEERNKVVL